ncbi:MAG: Concanavalin A-like lectin/glucanase superfamily [Thermoleophilia bacterium]|nr:Concanavalin A-like lectin/glucanase superfamily [Thermoleophilia bacterium]
MANGTTSTLYLDGLQVAQVGYTGTIDVQGGINPALRVGDDYGNTNRFVGSIDEVRVQSIAATPAAIRSYATGAVRDHASGIADFVTGSMFATCLRGTTGLGVIPAWSTSATCPASDGTWWRPIDATTLPATAKVAGGSNVGVTDATASFRFGVSVPINHPPGTYAAPISFEVLAPSA